MNLKVSNYLYYFCLVKIPPPPQKNRLESFLGIPACLPPTKRRRGSDLFPAYTRSIGAGARIFSARWSFTDRTDGRRIFSGVYPFSDYVESGVFVIFLVHIHSLLGDIPRSIFVGPIFLGPEMELYFPDDNRTMAHESVKLHLIGFTIGSCLRVRRIKK